MSGHNVDLLAIDRLFPCEEGRASRPDLTDEDWQSADSYGCWKLGVALRRKWLLAGRGDRGGGAGVNSRDLIDLMDERAIEAAQEQARIKYGTENADAARRRLRQAVREQLERALDPPGKGRQTNRQTVP